MSNRGKLVQLHITLRQLEVFCAIVKMGSAVAAGQKIGLSQSAISSSLKELEKHMGELLFDRIGKRLVCNEQGKRMYVQAFSLLEQANELEQMFNTEAGLIHIAASTTIGNYLLPSILSAFRKVHSNIMVRVTIANTSDVIDKLSELECDIGLVEGGCQHTNIDIEVWQYDELVWFRANYSEHLKDNIDSNNVVYLKSLITKPLIIRETGSGTQQLLETALSQYGLTLEYSRNQGLQLMELGNSEAIKEAVRHDLGIGCLSRHAIADFLELGLLKEIVTYEPNISRPLLIIQHNQKSTNKLLSLFKDFLLNFDNF